MKTKTLVMICGGIAVVAMGMGTLISRGRTPNRHTEIPKPRIVCEYVDTNNNGKYDEMRYFKESMGKLEPLDLGMPYSIGFASPLGGSYVYGEVDREVLEVMFKDYHFPKVDEIIFRETKLTGDKAK